MQLPLTVNDDTTFVPLPMSRMPTDAEIKRHKRFVSIQMGYTGDSCGHCGEMTMRQVGTCLRCDCGETTSCS